MRLIDAMKLWRGGFPVVETEYERGWNDALDGAARAAPTIDAMPVVHSSWDLHGDGSGTCRHCNHRARSCWDDDGWMHYCPNCGAKMDGVE